MDCDAWVWNAACKLLPACRFEYEKKRLKNIIKLYQEGFYDEADEYITTAMVSEDVS